MMSRFSQIRTVFFVMAMILMNPHFVGGSVPVGGVGAEAGYHFVDHLRDAEVWGVDSRGYQKRGLWKKDRFLFPGVSADAEVRGILHTDSSGREHSVIRFHTLSSIRRVIEFDAVPSGSTLVIDYGILSEREEDGGVSYVNFRVSLGKNQLREIRIENKQQLQRISIPLGIYSFLNRPGVFRFEIFSDSDKPIHFYFDGQIQP